MTRQAVAVGGQGAKTDLPLRCAGKDDAASSGMLAAGERRGVRVGSLVSLAIVVMATVLATAVTRISRARHPSLAHRCACKLRRQHAS